MEAAEGAAKTAARAAARGNVVKQEKVNKIAQSQKYRTPLQSCCSHRAALLTRVQGETAEGTEKKADAANTQDAKIYVVSKPCKKKEGCSRMSSVLFLAMLEWTRANRSQEGSETTRATKNTVWLTNCAIIITVHLIVLHTIVEKKRKYDEMFHRRRRAIPKLTILI